MKIKLWFPILLTLSAFLLNVILYQFQDLLSQTQASNDSYSQILLLLDSRKPAREEKAASNVKFGVASYYDYVLDSGWSSKGHRVCAARDWPRGTMLKVKNIENGKEVICKVTDYGPSKEIHPDRIVDLSSFSFSQIENLGRGIVKVSVEISEK